MPPFFALSYFSQRTPPVSAISAFYQRMRPSYQRSLLFISECGRVISALCFLSANAAGLSALSAFYQRMQPIYQRSAQQQINRQIGRASCRERVQDAADGGRM